MERWVRICLISLFFSSKALAINIIPFYNIFYIPSEHEQPKPYIELYWQVGAKSIQYRQDSTGIWLGKILTEIRISNDTGVIVNDQYILSTTPANSVKAAELQNIIDLHRYVLPEGDATVTVKLTDMYTNDSTVYNEKIKVEAGKPTPFMSGLQILDTTYAQDIGGIFSKNNSTQVPLCANFLADHRKILHYYFEIYNTLSIDSNLLPLVQKSYISKKPGEAAVYNLTHTDTLRPGFVLPIAGNFDIQPLPSGNYYLNVQVSDQAGDRLATRNLFFQRSNANPTQPVYSDSTGVNDSVFYTVQIFDISSMFVAKYDIRQLKAIMKMITPISTQNELLSINGFMNQPDLTYMRYFLYNFWKSRFPLDPEKGWKEYAEKVKIVNKEYGSRIKPGYETDRGLVYLKYGKPDLITTISNEPGAYPYEIWQYNSPGQRGTNGIFLFYQPGYMVGGYKLLHSTVYGEVRNTNWRSQLFRSGVSNQSVTSQAELIIQD